MKNKALPAAIFTVFACLLLTLAPAAMAAGDQWIHVKVRDSHGEEEVTVNLPLSLLSAAAQMIPEEVNSEAEIALDDINMSWSELRDFWNEVRDAPEATFVTVETRDENVEVKKEGRYILVRTTERGDRGADVNVRFPMEVVDALLSGPNGTLNFEAALHALAAHGPGNLVSIRDQDQSVDVWIDNKNTAD